MPQRSDADLVEHIWWRLIVFSVLNLGMQKKIGQNHNLMIPLLDTGILCAKALRIKKIHVPQILRLVSLDKILLDRGFKKIRTYEIMRCFKEEISKPEVPIGFRSVTLKDIYNIEKFVELQNQSFSGSWGFSPNKIKDIEFGLNMKNTGPEDILILEKEGEFVAYIWLSKSITGTRKAWIKMTGVLPEYRGSGFGKYMLQQGLYNLIPNQSEYHIYFNTTSILIPHQSEYPINFNTIHRYFF